MERPSGQARVFRSHSDRHRCAGFLALRRSSPAGEIARFPGRSAPKDRSRRAPLARIRTIAESTKSHEHNYTLHPVPIPRGDPEPSPPCDLRLSCTCGIHTPGQCRAGRSRPQLWRHGKSDHRYRRQLHLVSNRCDSRRRKNRCCGNFKQRAQRLRGSMLQHRRESGHDIWRPARWTPKSAPVALAITSQFKMIEKSWSQVGLTTEATMTSAWSDTTLTAVWTRISTALER